MATVEVPGADGSLDFTEYFGEPKYYNRNISMFFYSFIDWEDHMAQDSIIKNALHGKRMKITFEEDDEYYWIGRISVGDWEDFNGVGKLTISAEVEPYKYKQNITEVTEEVASATGQEYTLVNDRKTVFPRITTSANIQMTFGDTTVNLSAGDDIIVDGFKLTSGDNLVTLKGTSTVTFKYQEGSL